MGGSSEAIRRRPDLRVVDLRSQFARAFPRLLLLAAARVLAFTLSLLLFFEFFAARGFPCCLRLRLLQRGREVAELAHLEPLDLRRVTHRARDAGERFWIFRSGDGEDAATGSHRWFLHGIFG